MELDYKTSCLGKLMGFYCEGIAALSPRALLLGGVWWLTRAIELQNTKRCHIRFLEKQMLVQWLLPICKTDPYRSQPCICHAGDNKWKMVCPYHTMHTHVEQLDIHFRENVGTDNSNLPLFPDKDGNALTNAEIVDAIRLVWKEAGVELFKTNTDGKDVHRFDKHCLKVTGAELLSKLGMDIATIQLYSRHSSNAILTYVQQAPLDMLPSTTLTAIAGVDGSMPSHGTPGRTADMANIWAEIRALQISLKKDIVDDMTPPPFTAETVGTESRIAILD
jgi:hypothetical protein